MHKQDLMCVVQVHFNIVYKSIKLISNGRNKVPESGEGGHVPISQKEITEARPSFHIHVDVYDLLQISVCITNPIPKY